MSEWGWGFFWGWFGGGFCGMVVMAMCCAAGRSRLEHEEHPAEAVDRVIRESRRWTDEGHRPT